MSKKMFYLVLASILFLTACTGETTPVAAMQPNSAEVEQAHGITAEGILLPERTAELAFIQPGMVDEVLVQPGETVATGQVLARLTGREMAVAELEAARLEQILAEQALEAMRENALLSAAQAQQNWQNAHQSFMKVANSWRLDDGGDFTDLELALDDYVQAEKDYGAAYAELQRLKDQDAGVTKIAQVQRDFEAEKERLAAAYTDLLRAIPGGDKPLEARQSQLMQAIAALELAREQAYNLQAGLDPEQQVAAEARLKAADAHVAAVEAALANYELRAPFAGTVFSLYLAAGDVIAAGIPVVFVADVSNWVVETTDLAEIDTPGISIGDAVRVRLDAFSEEEFSGEVVAIDPLGREYLGDITYKVTIILDEADARFLWNMTATVRIETRE